MSHFVSVAAGHIRDIFAGAIKRAPEARVVVIYDLESGLSQIVADGYREAVPDALCIDFAKTDAASILKLIDELSPGDVVVLVQSSSFRLNEFRIRIELYKRKLKAIEHVHLGRMSPDQYETWVETLAFDQAFLQHVGHGLKRELDAASTVKLIGKDTELVWEGGVEECKLNIGDYSGMENVGGTFPIGEVISEARDFTKLNGTIRIYAFAGEDFMVQFFEPFVATVVEGIIEPGPDAPQAFIDLVALIKASERPLVRELGIGLNRAITREKFLNDITAFERILGVHLSLGEKHGIFKKPGFNPAKTRFHVDVFPAFDRLEVDGKTVFDNTLDTNQILV